MTQENKIKVDAVDITIAVDAMPEATQLQENVTDLVITNPEKEAESGEILLIIKGKQKELEDARKKIVAPLNEAKAQVQALFKKPMDVLNAAEGVIKRALATYDDLKEKARKEEERKLREEEEKRAAKERAKLERKAEKAEAKGDEEKAEELRMDAEQVVVFAPTVKKAAAPKGVSYREVWYAEVINKDKIPVVYMEPNMSMLNAHARNTKGQVPIEGVKFLCRKEVASRSK